jgi:hypothetical protein
LRELQALLDATEENNARQKAQLQQENVLMSVNLERVDDEARKLKAVCEKSQTDLTKMEDALSRKKDKCDTLNDEVQELKEQLELKEM